MLIIFFSLFALVLFLFQALRSLPTGSIDVQALGLAFIAAALILMNRGTLFYHARPPKPPLLQTGRRSFGGGGLFRFYRPAASSIAASMASMLASSHSCLNPAAITASDASSLKHTRTARTMRR